MGDKNASSDTHVLNDEWTFYLNERPPKGISQEEYERSIHKWGVFSTIEVPPPPPSQVAGHCVLNLNLILIYFYSRYVLSSSLCSHFCLFFLLLIANKKIIIIMVVAHVRRGFGDT
jgi:hypothetical protein